MHSHSLQLTPAQGQLTPTPAPLMRAQGGLTLSWIGGEFEADFLYFGQIPVVRLVPAPLARRSGLM